jgi:hypothetical protein
MKAQGGGGECELQFHMFLNSELDGLLSSPGSHRLNMWVGPREGVHIVDSAKIFFPAKHNLDLSVN